MIYRLLAMNIDGTLLRSNGRFQSETKEAIEFVENKGIYVTLVTNRTFPSAKKVAKALKLDDNMLITHGGARVSSTMEEPLFTEQISEQKTFNLVQVLETFDCHVKLFHERYVLSNKKRLPGNLLVKAVLGSGDPFFYPTQFVESLGDSLRDQPLPAYKMEIRFQKLSEQHQAIEAIQNGFSGIDVKIKQNNKIEIEKSNVSKLNGLEKLANHLEIPMSETVTIGHEEEDIPMIEAAGLGVAMWNAPVKVKKAADWITRSNDHNGVSYMVREHFRKQQSLEFLRQMKIEK